MIFRLIKLLFILALLGGIALVGFAYLGPVFMPAAFDPPVTEIRVPVMLDSAP